MSYADGKTVELGYNPLRQLTAMHDWLGTTKIEVDARGRLTSLTHSKDGSVLDQFQYQYDPAGNITQIEKHRAGMEADKWYVSVYL